MFTKRMNGQRKANNRLHRQTARLQEENAALREKADSLEQQIKRIKRKGAIAPGQRVQPRDFYGVPVQEISSEELDRMARNVGALVIDDLNAMLRRMDEEQREKGEQP